MEANGVAGNPSIMSHKICYAWNPFLKVPEKRSGVDLSTAIRKWLWKSLCKTFERRVNSSNSLLFNEFYHLDIYCPVENLGISHAVFAVFRAIYGKSISEARVGGPLEVFQAAGRS